MPKWTIAQARRYQLWAVRLLGTAYAPGPDGIRSCFRDLGGLQLDPLPVLGRNHDLVLQSRVEGIHPDEGLDLIHRERLGFEYWDKVLCAIPIDAYPRFRPFMLAGGESWTDGRAERLHRDHPGAIEAVYDAVRAHGPLSSRELKNHHIAQGDHREWKSTKAANAALEVLWNRGRLAVSHRSNYRRYFDLAERVIPSRHLADGTSIDKLWPYLVAKRVRAVGLLPASGDSTAWALLRAARAEGLPERLVEQGALTQVEVAGIKTPFYAPADAEEGLSAAESLDPPTDVARFIAPLDPLLWARVGLERVWGFSYVWEVYKPIDKRRYGYYVLPVLVGDRFVARFDGRYDRSAERLLVHAYYEEDDGLPHGHPTIRAGFRRFLEYLGGEEIAFPSGEVWRPDP